MVHDDKYGPETSYEERKHHRMQVVYAHKMREQQVFMQELRVLRQKRDKRMKKTIIESIGPRWYQALSVPQRVALDTLETTIYQDMLEGRPIRTASVMVALGLYPRPNSSDLMNCVYYGREDPKEMLAHLFFINYGHTIDGKQSLYCLNAKLILSGILYLGLGNLINLLRERFRAEPQKKKLLSKPKPKLDTPPVSPYLQKMIAFLYEVPKKSRFRPAPLPNLDDLNEPYEEPPIPKPAPLSPVHPPPTPKKKLPRSFCDKLAGVISIEPHAIKPRSSVKAFTVKTVTRGSNKKMRSSKMCLTEGNKAFAVSGSMASKKSGHWKKLQAPSTGMSNAQFMITGVYTIHGKTVFVLGNVSILPPLGEVIHGGYKYIGSDCINIHCGFKGSLPPPKADPCDCVKKWTDTIFQYVRSTKCYCGHHFDYGNEGSFLPEELPFFQKASRNTPHAFNYETIYDLDPKSLHVEKEFKRLWDTDSVLHVDDGTNINKKETKKKKKRSSTTCLGQNPKPEDYLKCALRLMRRVNIAARLPDIHLVPELKEWMRRRIYGPYSRLQKSDMLLKSSSYWQYFQMLDGKSYGHISPLRDPQFAGHTTWGHKQDLNDKFRQYTQKYRMEVYRSQAKVINMMWPSMCQSELPDKKFREIYFSYMYGRIEDLQIMHPYSTKEAMERKFLMAGKRYCCVPAGIEPPV